MADEQEEQHVTYVPASPNVGAADPDGEGEDRKRAVKDQRRSDDLAEKVAMADELSGYEKVAGRGVDPDASPSSTPDASAQ